MAMELNRIIQTWYSLANGADIDQSDVFFKFIALWVAFNALYASRHSSDIGDWDQVRSFAGDPDAVDRHRDLLKIDREYLAAIEFLKERGVRDLNRGPVRRIRDSKNLTEVASCVYQVRCNLFHGGKTPQDPRDASLVQACYTIVIKLIEPLIGLR